MRGKEEMSCMESIWKQFDYIACICYTGNKHRVEELKPELARVGLLGLTHFHWDFPDKFKERMMSSLKFFSASTRTSFHCGYNHYRAIKMSLALGREHIMVIEDDVRFLRDLAEVRAVIETMPKDYDLAMFDKNWPSGEMTRRNLVLSRKENDRWLRIDKFFSSGGYAMSRRGMARFVEIYESAAFGKGPLKSNDQYFNIASFGSGMNLYAAHPNLCVQVKVEHEPSTTNLEGYWARHEEAGMTQGQYNIQTSIVTKVNFLELLYKYVDDNPPRNGDVVFCNQKNKAVAKPLGGAVTADRDAKGIGAVCIWGNANTPRNREALQVAYKSHARIMLCEDGFIRSMDTWVGNSDKGDMGRSVIYDGSGYYFDATRVSEVERMLNDSSLLVSPEDRAEARRLIDKIVRSKVSKYNHQPLTAPALGRKGVRKVLVVDQSYGDFSIARGLASDKTFRDMLAAAVSENPGCDVLVKTHPDTLAGKKGERKGYYQGLACKGNVFKVTCPVNPYSLLEMCDKVYVVSSQLGFEALMAGKEVHVFGMPFYAGWGLTNDRQHLDRRTNMRTIEEVFHIFYCKYTHWLDIERGRETTVEAVIDRIISLRGGGYKRIANSKTEKVLRNLSKGIWYR